MNYADIYTHDFFHDADGMAEWKVRKLKVGDALAAIGYAFGLNSLEALRAVVPFEGVGRNTINEAEKTLVGDDDGFDIVCQLAQVFSVKSREPKGFLEIGAGRGEVSVALAHLDYPVQAVEPSPGAADWFVNTAKHMFPDTVGLLMPNLLNVPAHEALDAIDWSKVDTVLMVESLEHILAEDFEPVYERVRDHLRSVGGRFIITNWVDYHPINVGDYAPAEIHCRLVDDALYDSWSKDAKAVVYRNGSHLVLDY